MRLGQLARKIGVQPSRISTFLEKQNVSLDAGSNTKLTEEQENLVKIAFDYEEVEEVEVPVVKPEVEEEVLIEEVAAELIIKEEDEAEEPVIDSSEIKNDAVSDTDNNDDIETIAEEVDSGDVKEDDMEVIRAPKLKLDGLKVVGKIDLPEPKVKEEAAPAADGSESSNTETPSEKEVQEKPLRKKANYKKPKNRRPEKRELSLEEKQDREARLKKRKAKEKKELEKQLKAAHYEAKMREKQLASISPKKTKKKLSKQKEQYSQKSTQPEPKSAWGKFLRWLNS